jgi:hypothetical protein
MGPRFPAERFRGTDGHAEDLPAAVRVDADGDCHGDRHNAPALADLEIGRIDPEIDPLTPPDVPRTSGNSLRWSEFMGINPSMGRGRKASTRSSFGGKSILDRFLFRLTSAATRHLAL